ncbi:Transmembrane and coiled-coil domains 1 [Gossypium arboreum]|nr:Transmembrane and coiled-coil domains 1 [Gossypium arboreum]
MSGTWHWHQYETSCKTIARLSASIYMILLFQVVQRVIPRSSQQDDKYRQARSGSKDVGARFTLSN